MPAYESRKRVVLEDDDLHDTRTREYIYLYSFGLHICVGETCRASKKCTNAIQAGSSPKLGLCRMASVCPQAHR